MRKITIIVEKHADCYVAYPVGVRGVVVGEGPSYEEAVADVKSALQFHVDTFGPEVLEEEPAVLEAFVAEVGMPDAADASCGASGPASHGHRGRARISLDELLAQIPDDYRPTEEPWGPPVGREAW